MVGAAKAEQAENIWTAVNIRARYFFTIQKLLGACVLISVAYLKSLILHVIIGFGVANVLW